MSFRDEGRPAPELHRITFDTGGVDPVTVYWTLQGFENYPQYLKYVEALKALYSGGGGSKATLDTFLKAERDRIDDDLRKNNNFDFYGIPQSPGKAPKSFDEGMAREEFVYWDEYKKEKDGIQKEILDALAKNSTAEAMQDKMVFNDMELGEFVYDRAAMGLIPEIFYYSPTHKRALDVEELDIKSKKYALLVEIEGGEEKYFYKPDHTPLVLAVKVDLDEGGEEFVEVGAEGVDLDSVVEKGVINASSFVKKSYQYKQKQPRINNAIRLVVGFTHAGGYTAWKNDWYGGVAAGIVIETLESLGYYVSVDVVFGGRRCDACGMVLNTADGTGGRFLTINIKRFDENLNLDRMLYMLCDPSFYSIKLMSNMQCFLQLYGDQKDVGLQHWHSVQFNDLRTPVGAAMMMRDFRMGNTDVMYYLIHQLENKTQVKQAILDIVLNAENENLKLKEKALTYSEL